MPENRPLWKPTLILGGGFVGQGIYRLQSSSYSFKLTSRQGDVQGEGSPQSPLLFDLARRETWGVVDQFESILWTFPAAGDQDEISLSLEFYDAKRLAHKQVLILGSTSCFIQSQVGQIVDESFSLDLSQPRVMAEEELRKKSAFVLCLAGIYGPGRDPSRWVKNGLIHDAGSFINLIHISDIFKIVECWRKRTDLSGMRLIASDGRFRRWFELIEQMKNFGVLTKDFDLQALNLSEGLKSKRVSNENLIKHLYSGPFHLYPEHGL